MNKKLMIRMVRVPEYNNNMSIATISVRDLFNNIDTKELLSVFENEYNNTINKCKKLLSLIDDEGKKDNKKILTVYWRVGDLIYKLLLKARNKNLVLINYERSIGRDLDITPSKIYYLLHFRMQHEKIKDVNFSVPWSWYCELTKIKSKDKLRYIEKSILEGKIKNKKELLDVLRT